MSEQGGYSTDVFYSSITSRHLVSFPLAYLQRNSNRTDDYDGGVLKFDDCNVWVWFGTTDFVCGICRVS